MVFEQALHAFFNLLDPLRFAFVVLGVFIGLFVGVVPGIGGLVGLALVLPFTFAMDPHTALGFLVGLSAVTVTSDTIPAVLFGVPGTVGSAATVLDGHPMAKRGEAGRAFGAAFTASVCGGLFGAILLAVSIPVLRPFMLAVGTPELLAVCALGLTLVAALSQGAILKGVAAACLGIMISAIGDEPQTGEMRWAGDSYYLFEGLPLVPLALGLFAIPEMMDLAISRLSVARTEIKHDRWQQLQGVKDVFRNWYLVIKCSAIGSLLGSIPGIGASIIDWIAYGYAARTLPGAADTFGKGDVRGVIASESSNNAKEGGALVPTLAFGVPGSASMALLLGAFMMHGITPGPKLLTTQLDVTFTMIWSVAIANIVGAGLCFAFAGQFAKLALVRAGILVPIVLAVTAVGAYQGSRDLLDLAVLLGVGMLGWIMKRNGWPRPPLVLGFVLGRLIENYLFISVARYQFGWLARPGVMIVIAILLFVLFRPLIGSMIARMRGDEKAAKASTVFGDSHSGPINTAIWAFFAACFIYAYFSSGDWEIIARLMPQTVAIVGLVAVGAWIVSQILAWKAARAASASGVEAAKPEGMALADHDPLAHLDTRTIGLRALEQAVWFIGLGLLVAAIGMLPAVALFLFFYLMRFGEVSILNALLITVAVLVFMFGLFDRALHMPWPDSWLGDTFPVLRSLSWLKLV
jgi:TctA family transporter